MPCPSATHTHTHTHTTTHTHKHTNTHTHTHHSPTELCITGDTPQPFQAVTPTLRQTTARTCAMPISDSPTHRTLNWRPASSAKLVKAVARVAIAANAHRLCSFKREERRKLPHAHAAGIVQSTEEQDACVVWLWNLEEGGSSCSCHTPTQLRN